MVKFIETENNGIVSYRHPEYDQILQETLERQKNIDLSNVVVPTVEDDLNWLRTERNRRLVESDWTQLPDVPEEIRIKWQIYRQELRDITNIYQDMVTIVWPEKPE